MHGKNEKCTQNVIGKYESDHLEDLGMNGRVIFMWILKNGCVNWIHLAENVD